MDELYESMKQELSDTAVGRDFEEAEDINLLNNLMTSISSQEGQVGPGSNILRSLGMKPR
jgi:hypothetical protein